MLQSSRVARTGVSLGEAAWRAAAPVYADALSSAAITTWRKPLGISAALPGSAAVAVPVWKAPFCGALSCTLTSNEQVVLPLVQPRDCAVPVLVPPDRSIPSTRNVAGPMPLMSLMLPFTCTVSLYMKLLPVHPVFATRAGYVTPALPGSVSL